VLLNGVDHTEVDYKEFPQSRKEAMEIGSTRYFTGKACKHGHITLRNARNGRCTVCSRKNSHAARKKNREVNKEWAIEYLGGKCQHCQNVFDWVTVYEAHHLSKELKETNLGELVNPGTSLETFKKTATPELDKCILLCANCHRIEHADPNSNFNKKKIVDKAVQRLIIDISSNIERGENSMIVRGTAQWAHVFEPNEMSGKYQVDICNIDKPTAKALRNVGIDVKKGTGDKADKGEYIVAKSGRYAPKVMDRSRAVMDGTTLIGNGSKIKVSINPYQWTFKGKSGVSAGLNALMVTSLIAYGDSDELEAEDDDVGEDDDEL